ncbi:9078_t:CDS:1, partial [Funneliformis geosporum]
YVGNFKRTQRRKKSAAKIATAGISKLDIFFFTPQQIPYQSAKELAYNLKKLEKDQKQEGYELALKDIRKLIANKSFILQVKIRLQLIMQYINLMLSGLK